MKKLLLCVIACAVLPPARAASYVEQASFAVAASTIAGLDRDSVGNLYVLGLAEGTTLHAVSGYRAPGLEPLFSFGTGVRSPLAFAVEPSGTVDVLDGANSLTLRRFLNTGYFLGEASYSLGPNVSTSSLMAAAIDKTNGLLYLAYQNWRSFFCVGVAGVTCPPSGLMGYVNVHDFSGQLVRVVELPGISATAGSCYTPSKIAAGPQGELFVADLGCQKLLRFSPSGTFQGETSASQFGSFQSLRAMWTDADSSLYLSQAYCGAGGCPWSVVKVSADGNLQSALTADSLVGSGWDARILYTSSAGRSPLRRMIFNEAPSVPAATAPLGPVVQHSSAAWLRWQASTDNDGDPILYTLELGTSPFVLRSTGTADVADFTTAPLAFGATYYWRVTARDSYLGLPLQSRASSVENFVLGLLNAPPAPFVVASGGGSALTRDSSIVLSWTPAVDPDGDAVSYALSWRPAGQLSPNVSVTTATKSQPLTDLTFGTTYFWSVVAQDVYGASQTLTGGTTAYLPLLLNTAPEAFAVLTGSAPVATRATAWPLSWAESSDADGDEVSYELALGTSPQALGVVQSSSATAYVLSLQYGATCYWQVTARDGFGGVTTPGLQTFRADFLNTPPASPQLDAPFLTSPTVKTMRDGVSVAWDKVANAQGDAITYTAYLGEHPAALQPVASVEQAASAGLSVLRAATASASLVDQGDKVSLLLSGLDYYRSYYFQVAAQTAYGAVSLTPLQTFSLAPADSFPRAYNYPNPFSPGRGGTRVVFNAPAGGYARAVLTVYSEFGQKLYERDHGPVPPGISQVGFAGRDQHGRALMNGSYVARVRFDGPSETATFFLLVVK